MELGIEALLFTCADAYNKLVPRCFSHRGTNAHQAIHERHSTPRLRDKVQRLRAPIVLTDPTKSLRPTSCFTMQAKSTQHGHKHCAVVLGRALTLNSHLLFSILFYSSLSRLSKCATNPSSMSRLTILRLRGLACSHKNPERRGSACSTSL